MIMLQKIGLLTLLSLCFYVTSWAQSASTGIDKEIDDSKSIIGDWEISKKFDNNIFYNEIYPRFYGIFFAGWKKIKAEPNGLINVSGYYSLTSQIPGAVYARTYIVSGSDKKIKAAFIYGDAIKIFLNQNIIYSGRSRSNLFVSTLNMQDTLYLDLKKGRNELFLMLLEGSGGWGFAFKSIPEVEEIRNSELKLTKLWESEKLGLQPESAVYDPHEKVIYVSVFDNQFNRFIEPRGYISKIKLNGEIIARKWLDNLYSPSGICIFKDNMYILERKNLVRADLKTGRILNRIPFPENIGFPNDIIVNGSGDIYFTNSAAGDTNDDIFLFKNGKLEMWYASNDLSSVNGIEIADDEIIIGNSGKGLLQAINLQTKNIRNITSIGASIIDGIEKTSGGDIIVSDWLGGLFRVTQAGEITQILEADGISNIANFEFIENEGLLIIPSFLTGTVQAYSIK